MDPEILINSPESDEDLFDIGYPPSSGQQTDPSQASERSRVCSAISVPHTSRYRSSRPLAAALSTLHNRARTHSTLHNRARTHSTPHNGDRTHSTLHNRARTHSTPHNGARTHSTLHNRARTHSTPHNGARTHSTLHNRAQTTEVDSHATPTFPEGKRHPLSPK
ncbi:hypothetical protein OYC64_018444 [Pagothenia borchgrevinki]|uniref:Uncharacterized protein n=1 Tax=Pagothenia borchgrevinki TaxID=8213 RepID=A0ABD2GPX6_PAGBO